MTNAQIRLMKDFSLDNRFRVKKGKGFALSDYDPAYTADLHSEEEAKRDLKKEQAQMYDLQDKLYANKRNAILVIFQAMDAAGAFSDVATNSAGRLT